MFESLILSALRSGPKRTKELYRIAEARQPESCRTGPCTCHHRVKNAQPEWRHQLRRDQYALSTADAPRIRLVAGKWELV